MLVELHAKEEVVGEVDLHVYEELEGKGEGEREEEEIRLRAQ